MTITRKNKLDIIYMFSIEGFLRLHITKTSGGQALGKFGNCTSILSISIASD